MIKLKYITLLLCSLFLICLSCKNNSYAEKRKAEQRLWQEYKGAKGLEISTDSAYCFNRSCPWPENLYFQTYRGAYIRLVEDDTTKRRAKDGQEIIFRFCSYDLYGNLQIDNHNHNKYREGFNFVYTPGSSDRSIGIACIDAVGCIHHGTKFDLIIDSKLGTYDQQEEVITLLVKVDETTINNQ
jgi:hypothetical protein